MTASVAFYAADRSSACFSSSRAAWQLRYPFAGQSLPQLIMKIIGGRFTPLPSTFSPQIRELVSSLLQQRPQHRPSAEQLLQSPALSSAVSLLQCARHS